MIDRHVGFDATGTFSILKDLATFHAVPLAIKTKNPELFAKNILPHCSMFGMGETEAVEYVQQMSNWLKQIPELTGYIDQLDKVIMESSPFGPKEIREPWSTILHLDFWSNNIMVTNEAKNMILDLQIPQQGSVTADLIFFLLTSVKFDVIKERLDEFIKFYYDEFIENLKQLKVDTSCFTFEGLLEDIAKEVKFGEFAHSLGHAYGMLAEKGVAQLDSSDANYKPEDAKPQTKVNEGQIGKLRWMSLEVLKRNWI